MRGEGHTSIGTNPRQHSAGDDSYRQGSLTPCDLLIRVPVNWVHEWDGEPPLCFITIVNQGRN